MKIPLFILSLFLLSACGSAPSGGSSSGGGASSSPEAPGSLPNSNLHTYELWVYGENPDFVFAPAIIGPSSQTSPGPQSVVFGETKKYTLTSESGDVQITGSSASNPNFFVSIQVFKDGALVGSGNVGIGVSRDYPGL